MCSPSGGAAWESRSGVKAASVGRNPASVLPAPVSATSNACRPASAAASISSWCRRTRQPRAVNQSASEAGSDARDMHRTLPSGDGRGNSDPAMQSPFHRRAAPAISG
ncbi:hypothetical protein GCM10011617_01970 [Novosphingobium arvoryzae]|uniref:Uncharacterized protein n=1 Tax=Novosphingobium arvoryzae TaxID=1256514 RepID=A0A918R5J7_9SPHN|nr:hypothetical protein GCM10011617_01970 [Novosphingobium arvoryzae]